MLASLCSALPAQDSGKTAAIEIEVKDESGGIIPNAQVQIAPSPNDVGKNLMTDVDGRLHLDMPPGIFDLSVTSPGFARMKKQFEVQDATPQLVSVLLAPGWCSQGCGVVTEASPLLSPEHLPAVSPDGRFAIVEIASDWVPRHTIFLEDRVLKTQRKLFSYDQPESFLWNYDSKVFAVSDNTNFLGDDTSLRSIFSVDEKARSQSWTSCSANCPEALEKT
jgi:hypothetical protein